MNKPGVYALATPTGGAIAIIRMSGEGTREALSRLFTAPTPPRTMAYGRIVGADGETVDEAMAAFFPAPASYTGEDMAELYIHGGAATAASVMRLLGATLSPAEPGEFTRRAFLNGKLALSDAEAVMDLISAAGERSAKSALLQLSGATGRAVGEIEDMLYDALAAIDAATDYPDELEEEATRDVPAILASAHEKTVSLVECGIKYRVLREGASVAICGRPNAGKSSLFNALLGRERAIVTAHAGTTRDTVEESVLIEGTPIRLTDTAGLRDAEDEAERSGVERAVAAARAADLVLLVFDSTAAPGPEDAALLEQTDGLARLAVMSKADLLLPSAPRPPAFGLETVYASAVAPDGTAALTSALAARLCPAVPAGEHESPLITNSRHIDALSRASAAIQSASAAAELTLAAVDIREALSALGSITGREVAPELVERIFKRFCVGK